ncbi:hypothetical protein ACWDXD_24625 [Streptomyces sp. NPDC003314]
MSTLDQAIDALYAEVRAYREAHRFRLLRELDITAAELTQTLLPPELRTVGFRLTYDEKALG